MTKKVISIFGATGFIGSKLSSYLESKDFEVIRFSRSKGLESNWAKWDPTKKEIDLESLSKSDVIINLLGKDISEGWWTDKNRKAIYESRIETTKFLVESINKLQKKPTLFISVSAVGIYGNQSNNLINEDSHLGADFLANLCKSWESESQKAKLDRVVNTRLGIVLGNGGFLKKLRLTFKLGLGATLGSGNQYMSFIDIWDLCKAMEFIIEDKSINGAVNLVMPKACTNKEFTKAYAKNLKRPAVFSIPQFILKAAFGKQKAQSIFLSSQNCVPKKLLDKGFKYDYPTLKESLNHLSS